jgi:hypothetical protein
LLAAAWVQAIAAVVTAAAVVCAVMVWAWNKRPRGVLAWIKARYFPLQVSLEAGRRTTRKFARSGRPPYTPTQGAVSPEQSLDYLLAKVTETVWNAAAAPDANLVPLRNYLEALMGKGGPRPRDFALGVLTERVRQEEDGWPDQPGDRGGNAQLTGPARHTSAYWIKSARWKMRCTTSQGPNSNPISARECVPAGRGLLRLFR